MISRDKFMQIRMENKSIRITAPQCKLTAETDIIIKA